MSKGSGVVKQILKDHFAGFWELHSTRFPESYRSHIKETVKKTIRCGTTDLGYARYECLGCEGNPMPKFVCFTCKSRLCHRCGKKYTDDWSDKQQEMIFNVTHRHMVFTIPQEIRKVFYDDRKKLNELSKQVSEVFQYHNYQKSKKRGFRSGIITVIHTFGRDLKFNPHIHALVTEGALDNNNEWVNNGYIPYDYLRKSWQKVVLDLLKKWFPNNQKVINLINELYQRYPKGFYVNAEKKMTNAKAVAKYIGRYLARPAIAEYRIEEYDGKSVHYWYEDHKTGKRVDKRIPVYRFIFEILQHVPPKHFRMVGRFGLYSRRSHHKAQQILSLHAFMRTKQIELLLEKKRKKKTYRQRMIESFEKDPFECPHCHRQMELVGIWHSDYGWLYHYMEDIEMERRRKYGIGKPKKAG
ncbi:transposase [Radiobacillus kanasensis]|uniref:IS91 family transposase n=1 Tax=Radiobacillus kanasensis TaxID=2844358 RepID=UPI001E291024|nr:transposase [Radiobacillus kanasensis]UFT98462.1 transposase [Radiobacillus kanasensis]UFT98834.1 transposase [Radiobacillus kanasensis]UFT99892.1 transposase [Radiobacillus kanasensis]